MKNVRTQQKQRGFFDLGLGLALSLVFGGTAAVIETEHTGETQLAKQNTEIVKHVDEQLAAIDNSLGC